jgi:hypothetical protein
MRYIILLTFTYSYHILGNMQTNPQSTEPLTKNDLIEVLETSALAQLRALRSLRRAEQRPAAPLGTKRKSNMDVVHDILLAAKGPLHITQILQRAKRDHHRPLRRESLVSALTQKVLDHNTFSRTAPNTFYLLKRPS